MNHNYLRSLLATALTLAMLLIGNVAPTQASINVTPQPLGCYRDDVYYPLGARIGAPPFGYLQCEWLITQVGQHSQVGWVFHSK